MSLSESPSRTMQIPIPLDSQSESIKGHSSAGLSWARYEYDYTGDVAQLLDSYGAWIDQPAYVILEDRNNPGKYRCFRGAKRGDSFYALKTLKRFDSAIVDIKKIDCLDSELEKLKARGFRVNHRFTQVVSVTLTYAEQRDENWIKISADFNRFMAMLRRRYGKVDAVRVWEAHESGYPHVHAVLFFKDWAWETFEHKGIYRLEKSSKLKECWKCGYSDWEGVYDLEASLDHLQKYLTKLLYLDFWHALLNLAKLWVYRKRSFSVPSPRGWISQRLDSGAVQLKPGMMQDVLEGEPILDKEHDWRLVCVVSSMVDLSKVQIVNVKEKETSRSVAGIGRSLEYIIDYQVILDNDLN